jgi:5-methylcytosine-specific restriction endonuclease McrA
MLKKCNQCGLESEHRLRGGARAGKPFSKCKACETIYKSAYKQREYVKQKARDYANKARTDDKTRDKILEAKRRAQATWKAANPEEHKRRATETQRTYRARKRGCETDLTREEWEQTLEYFKRSCAYCLRNDVPLTQDHVIPTSYGGSHSQDNVVPACRSCNARKGNRPVILMLTE